MKKALLLIDIQNDFFPRGKMELVKSVRASENAKLILHKFRQESLAVVHIQHIANWHHAEFFISGTIGARIHRNVKPYKDEKIIIKHYPDCFKGTELLDYLIAHRINHLVVCGMMIHMCVDATVRSAKDHGFNCTIISDACATKDLNIDGKIFKAQEIHEFYLDLLSSFSIIKSTKEYIND